MEALPLMLGVASVAMNKPPKPPKPQPPAPLPDPEEQKKARAQRMTQMQASQGRASTNLTGNAPTAAPTFRNETLGS